MPQKILKLLKTPPTKDTQIAKDTYKRYFFFWFVILYIVYLQITPKKNVWQKKKTWYRSPLQQKRK